MWQSLLYADIVETIWTSEKDVTARSERKRSSYFGRAELRQKMMDKVLSDSNQRGWWCS